MLYIQIFKMLVEIMSSYIDKHYAHRDKNYWHVQIIQSLDNIMVQK